MDKLHPFGEENLSSSRAEEELQQVLDLTISFPTIIPVTNFSHKTHKINVIIFSWRQDAPGTKTLFILLAIMMTSLNNRQLKLVRLETMAEVEARYSDQSTKTHTAV